MRKLIIASALLSTVLLCGCSDDEDNNAPVSTATATDGYQTPAEYKDSDTTSNWASDSNIHAPRTSRWHSTITPSVGFVHSYNGAPHYTPEEHREYVNNNPPVDNDQSTGNTYADSMNTYHWHDSRVLVPAFNREVIAYVNGHSVLAEYVPNPNNETPGCPCGIWVRYNLGNHKSLIISRVRYWMNIPHPSRKNEKDFGGL